MSQQKLKVEPELISPLYPNSGRRYNMSQTGDANDE